MPEKLRVGPWEGAAPAYVAAMVYTVALALIVVGQHFEPSFESMDDYPPFGSLLWYYNLCGCLWMVFVSALIIVGPAGLNAWGTYTLWSWTVLCIRHGLSALAPWLAKDSFGMKLLEYTRFPAIAMASITFTIWNFLLFPFIYLFFMETPEKKRNFVKYFTSFKLIQLHVVNIFLAYGNVVMASPPRPLVFVDLVAALVVGVVYVLWYVLILDRLGVHIYPIFSPRSPWLFLTWTLSWLNYVASFYFWRGILKRTEGGRAELLDPTSGP